MVDDDGNYDDDNNDHVDGVRLRVWTATNI
jgi:hypothetical protein